MLLYRIYNGNHGPFEDEATGEAMADKLRLTGKAMPTPIYADYELAAIILKTCAPRPEDRFQTPAELKQALVYYMQRNEVSDTLIVPPIVTPEAPLAPEAETAEEEAPARMTDAEQLDEKFRTSFAPDLSGAGTEKDIDPDAVPDAPKPEQKPPTGPQPQPQPSLYCSDSGAGIRNSSPISAIRHTTTIRIVFPQFRFFVPGTTVS